MEKYLHHVSGVFAHREKAESALSSLVERGLPRERLRIFQDHSVIPPSSHQEESNEALKDVLVDSAIGTAVGTGISAAILAANVSLFVASPLVGTLVMLGWGASLGGIAGITAGTAKRKLSDLIQDAITSGQVVLVAETLTEQETAIAREVIQAAIGDYKDLSAVCE